MALPDKMRLRFLLDQYLERQCNQAELAELLEAIRDPQGRKELELISEDFSGSNTPAGVHEVDWEYMYDHIVGEEKPAALVRRMPVWKRWTVAAGVIGLLLVGGYFLVRLQNADRQRDEVVAVANDVKAPDANRATIQLADGRVVYLDSAGNGELADMNGVRLVKTADGQIAYHQQGTESPLTGQADNEQLVYNTLTNPRGSKVIDMALSDGSHVWLNAGSSVTYPVVFNGDERRVTLKGEGYFEIQPRYLKGGGRMPFLVDANGVTTEVLGTHFNVNAYDDENDVRVTLLEGSVRTIRNAERVLLKPGEQAIAADSGPLTVNKSADIKEVMAWKNNQFIFHSADIKSIGRQLEKWYGLELVYEGEITDHFTGIISRSVSAGEVFRMLRQTGTMNVRIGDKKVYLSK